MREFYLSVAATNLDAFVFDTEQLSVVRGGGLAMLSWPQAFFEESAASIAEGEIIAKERDELGLSGPFSHWPDPSKVTAITTGASHAIYRFGVPEDDEAKARSMAQQVKKQVETYFRRPGLLRYVTFVVHCLPVPGPHADSDSFRVAHQSLLALQRYEQMIRPSQFLSGELNKKQDPTRGQAPDVWRPRNPFWSPWPFCEVDGIHPVDWEEDKIKTIGGTDNKELVCDKTFHRWHYGRNMKRRVYRAFGGYNIKREDTGEPFWPSWEFDRLALRIGLPEHNLAGPIQDRRTAAEIKYLKNQSRIAPEAFSEDDPFLRYLGGKMAVLYIDGNRFGSIQNNCKEETLLQKWDQYIQKKRQDLLASLVQAVCSDCLWWAVPSQQDIEEFREQYAAKLHVSHRIETLLWGGDEMIWVAPAWRGWDLAKWFFEQTQDWRFLQGQAAESESYDLTHAVGLVFANYKAPIRGLKDAARNLSSLVKAQGPGHQSDGLAYYVLESFDSLGGQEVDGVLKRQIPPDMPLSQISLSPQKMEKVEVLIRQLRDPPTPSSTEQIMESDQQVMPRRKLLDLLRAQRGGGLAGAAYCQVWERFSKVGPTNMVNALKHQFAPDVDDPDPSLLYHVNQLWDYVCPEVLSHAGVVKAATKGQG